MKSSFDVAREQAAVARVGATAKSSALDPARVVTELKELRELTGDAKGAQRLAFTPTWVKARAWYVEKLAAVPGVETHRDAAGNFWATLPGRRTDKELLIGGHLDSVPNGGWLDGCLNVLAGLEVLRAIAAEGTPAISIRLVDWADEEGARFGRSLYGSSACSGALDLATARELTDKAGVTLPAALKEVGIDFERALEAKAELAKAAAYLELHIEQGPVLESKKLPMGVVVGTYGVERHAVTFTGVTAHAGSTPMNQRQDALAGVSRLHMSVRDVARSAQGVATVGSVVTKPGIVTAIVGEATMTLDQRNLYPEGLAEMLQLAQEAATDIARQEAIGVEWKKIWSIQPFPFQPHLIELGKAAVLEVCGDVMKLPSGPLHDAAEVCRAGVPTVMLFVQSLGGISHNAIEDTREEHLELSVRALHNLTKKTMEWLTLG